MTAYVPPKLTPTQKRAYDQGEFNFLCPFKGSLLTPQQAAQCFARSESFIYQMIEEGKLEVHAPGDRQKQRYKITRRSVLLLIAATANYNPADYDGWIEDLINQFSAQQLTKFVQLCTARRARMTP